ncbi:MFS transporter [Purpureocillium lilacinum]|uniref:MFS transporter n=1 Tax=Purpureocillium lilacinum TaxID=33203 RepID=A0A179FV38_PURLI|nr:MFS transporter [Purpureocillium lilacinum]
MALNIDYEAVPGTEQLIDANNKAEAFAHVDESDIAVDLSLTEQNWPRWKKYYQLFLVALYACAFSFGENTLGAAWTTVSKDTGVTLTNMNGGSALNYLLLGFVNIWWMPTANILGRRLVYLATTALCLATGFWLAAVHGTAQWMLNMIVNGVGTSAYQAIVQLAIFDMFFVHERGRMLSVYLFAQQLGSIIGLITGGSMSDTVGWRWSQRIVGLGFTFVLLIFFFSFEETLFPRFLFSQSSFSPVPINELADGEVPHPERQVSKSEVETSEHRARSRVGTEQFPRRSYLQILKPWAGFIYAFGATAGIVSFNTISEILTEAPYNFSTTSTGLVFFAALVGNIIGYAIGVTSDHVVIALSRRNGGVKEPEMRLYMLAPCFLLAATGYMMYGWGAQTEAHWVTIAIGIGAMISHQVGACTIATAYAMDCFPGISGELVVVLAMCSSAVNFAISYSVQPFIEAAGYGWTFFFFGLCVLASVLMAIPLVIYGKRWRIAKAPRYYRFLEEVGGYTD